MNVSHYIHEQPSPNREIMTVLRSWILDLGSHTVERISYRVPYFSYYGQLCYFSPGPDGVDLSFAKGYELADEQRILESMGRKQVRSITFYSLAQVEEHEDSIRRLLNEAAILNEYLYKRKQKKRK
jgi:hypothetical protein